MDYTLPPWGTLGRNFTLGVVSGGGKFVLQVLNTMHINGAERFRNQVLSRDPGTPLFTVCNHIRCFSLIHCLKVDRIFLVETLVSHCRQSQFQALKLADCSTLDDPVVLSGMLPWSFFWTESQHSGVRWSLCAREICYKSIFVR